MELQTGIEKLEAQIAALEKMLYADDPDFRMITCTGWRVVDKDGKQRISAGTDADGYAVNAFMNLLYLPRSIALRINF